MADIISLSEQLSSLSATHKECMSQISQLSKLSSESSRTVLSQQIHHTLRTAEGLYEALADSAPSSHTAKVGEDLRIARRAYRKALLAAKRNEEREALFAGRRRRDEKGNEDVSQKELLVTAGEDVTAALRRTQALLAGELQKSRFASETLAQSTEALRELGERYSAFDDVLGKSRELIRDLVKKNKSDRWYYEMAIKMLIGMLVWIVVRRLFWGPIWLLVVWPMKTTWWFVAGSVGLAVKAGKGTESSVSIGTETRAVVMQSPVVIASDVVRETETEREREREREGEREDAKTMSEVVSRIITAAEEEEATIMKNTMSRRVDDPTPQPKVEEEEEGDAEALSEAVASETDLPKEEAVEGAEEAVEQEVEDEDAYRESLSARYPGTNFCYLD
ncbi:hypothetical protein BZA05DRAFT_432310 [Tricharina praecox]|uniref:uncharacterized protein n=1 Tax=Tricharina praecox TaxID=43433 RepID=UPI002220A40B|nr:uncharacterized protein BZA05DRAFT_432310 [Tricharina praecox]KAI5858365.1 hypothetical protein BZA05DRAFT_432310 [Tricharina praecox]